MLLDGKCCRTCGDGESAELDNNEDHRLTALGGYLPDKSFLLVGDDSYRMYDAQEAIIESFALASGLVLALAILPGLFMGQSFLGRIEFDQQGNRRHHQGPAQRTNSDDGARR